MAELIISAGSALVSGISSIGTSIGGLLGIGGTAGGSASSGVLSALQIGSGVFSALSTLAGSSQKADGLMGKALDAEADAKQVQNDSLDRQRRLKAEALRAMGESDVAYAAAGVDLGFGDAADARTRSQDGLQNELSIERNDAEQKQYRHLLQSAVLRRAAKETRSTGYLAAIGQGLETGYKIARRG